ncbi:efflux RND transporter periplasmic adaptor subunit [Candidatus Parcubacteria bacterium]|nr:efflux RND transporter periplasmic adaptor subunit [Candidatus Parcubacteria bacterium]
MRERFISILTILSKPAVALGSAFVIGAVVIGLSWYATTASPSGSYVPVTVGPITEEVDVSGAVKAAHSTDLAFQIPGRIASVLVNVGDHVSAGQTLVALDASSQSAAVALAKANLEAQQARLASLTAGTRPEQLAIDETAVTQAKNALENALTAAYINADDAVHGKADQLFTNPTNPGIQLIISPPTSTNPLVGRVEMERLALEPALFAWHTSLASVATDTESLTTSSETTLQNVASFLDDLTAALVYAQQAGSVGETSFTGYQTSINAGRLEVSTALSALISAETAYKAADGTLVLAQAGATENDIAAQQAAVDAAQASIDAAEAVAAQTFIAAPVSGTITVQNANLGETVVPGVPLVSMIADGKYEADAQVSEADIAKVKTNDNVEVTFAAYPGVTFDATVTTVDPAASTNAAGIASYGVTVTFLTNDERLKPGLSANLRIITATKNTALLVPTSAVITNGNQKFVYVKTASGTVRRSVSTGIESASGMTEIVSGLTPQDTVLSFGASPL